MPDVVYVNRPGEENEELRYSLRSLRNLPHGTVWIAGYTPSWVQGVESIPVPGIGDKQKSALANLIAALEHPEVSDPFYLFNDDFYVMRSTDEIPVLHLGSLQRSIEEHQFGSAYRLAMQKTYDRLIQEGADETGPLLSYELHAPILIEKLGMQLALSLGKGIYGYHLRTAYGNLMEVGGTEVKDFKVYRTEKETEYREWPFLSTSDRTFRFHPAGRYVRETFPDPSPYEKVVRTRAERAIRYRSVVINP